jgi:heat shock protein HtpX
MQLPPVVVRVSAEQRRRHKLRNLLHSLLLLSGMVAILGVSAFAIWGGEGVVWAVLGGVLGFLLSPTVPPEWVMRMYGAVPIRPRDAPELHELVDMLSRRAELPRPPALWWIPSPILNAFAVGSPDRAAIAVTDALLRTLTFRELAGVLAHEISHVRNNDLWIMQLADTMSRFTSLLSWLGQFLLILNLPLMLTGHAAVSWLAVLVLIFAPTIMALLQLALSRAREFDADLDAAGLTGDPAGLASALEKLERYQGRFWEEIFLPGRRIPEPSLLRTHPPTEERIRRLLSLYEATPVEEIEQQLSLPERLALPGHFAPAGGRPRFRRMGVWY